MKRDDHIDYHLVEDHHVAVHEALNNWARWVRVRPHGWQVSPMFAAYRSNWRQWHVPEIRPMTNIPEAVEMEKLVSGLPEKQRYAVRWAYIFQGNPAKMARFLGVSMQGLKDLVGDARTMLRNRQRADERSVETY